MTRVTESAADGGADQGTPVRVSVVVPVRDGAATLGAALSSALGQSLREIEVLVVDDGSTDGSGALARKLARKLTPGLASKRGDGRLRVLTHATPRGVAESRNHGAREARGSHLAFLDADDLWREDHLAGLLAALESRPGSAAAYGWVDYVDASGDRVGRGDRVRHQGDVHRELLLRFFPECASNLLVARHAFAAAGGFDPAFAGAADWDLALRLARDHPFAVSPRAGVLYRVGGGGMSSDVEVQGRECRRLLERELEAAVPAGERRSLRRRSLARLDHYLAFKALEDPDRRRGRRRARRLLARALARDPLLALHRTRLTLRLVRQLLPGATRPRKG